MRHCQHIVDKKSWPRRTRTYTRLNQNQMCYQLHQRSILCKYTQLNIILCKYIKIYANKYILLPPQGSNLQSSGSKSDMLAVYSWGLFVVLVGIEPTIFWFRVRCVSQLRHKTILFRNLAYFYSVFRHFGVRRESNPQKPESQSGEENQYLHLTQ